MNMKKTILLALTVFVIGSFTLVSAQEPTTGAPPSVADNASPADNNIKLRSVELERVRMDAEKTATLRRENGTELKFSIIKEDFEGIQKAQMGIINAYTKGKSVDYKTISESSDRITEMAVRLRANVFKPEVDGKTDEAETKVANPFSGKSVRDLIVALDNAIGDVVSSPMWQKLAVVDPEVSKVVEASLVKVINASGALWVESTKKTSK
jgi:hypothetical protein